MKKASAAVIIIAMLMVILSIIYSVMVDKAEPPEILLTKEEVAALDLGFDIIAEGKVVAFENKLLDKTKPLFVFLGRYSFEELNVYKDTANVVIFDSKENEKVSVKGFIYHYNLLCQENKNTFAEIRLLIREDVLVDSLGRILEFIDNGSLSAKILPNRIAFFDIIFIDKTNYNVYNCMSSIFERLNVAGVLLEVYGSRLYQKDNPLITNAVMLNMPDGIDSFAYYTSMLNQPLPIDKNLKDSHCYGLSPNVPTTYLVGRIGERFVYKNGEQKSLDAKSSFVNGTAFIDDDGNGYFDNKWDITLAEVTVRLYLDERVGKKLLAFDTTDKNGRYKIKIPQIYANAFDKLFIAVSHNDGQVLTFRSNETILSNNDINKDYRSDLFTIYSPIEIKILNIGYKN